MLVTRLRTISSGVRPWSTKYVARLPSFSRWTSEPTLNVSAGMVSGGVLAARCSRGGDGAAPAADGAATTGVAVRRPPTRSWRAMHVLAMHRDADRDRRQHQHRDADVPVRDAEREDDRQDDEADAADAARRVRSLTDRTVGTPRVGRDACPESSREVDGRDRSARAILAPAAPRASSRGSAHNVPVPERIQTAPPLTGRFAAAFALAWAVHGTQLRKKTGIPYMAHVMSVCALALENGADEDVAIAALLHDAVEDSEDGEATHSVIEEQFGERVARIVMACSDAVAVPGKPKPDWRERKETYLRHLDDEADDDVLLVSACDKVHNARLDP